MNKVNKREKELIEEEWDNECIMITWRLKQAKNNQNKVPLLEELANHKKLSFIALTETHLNNEVLDAEINMENYKLFRTDRENRTHGGVAIYLRQELAANASIITSFSNGTVELLALYIKY